MITISRILKLPRAIGNAWRITPLLCLLILLLLPVMASAEAYIYKDTNGVYRSAEKTPQETNTPKPDPHFRAPSPKPTLSSLARRLEDFCHKINGVSSEVLVTLYWNEAEDLQMEILKNTRRNKNSAKLIKQLNACTKQLSLSSRTVMAQAQKKMQKERLLEERNKSFTTLNREVKKRFKKRSRSGTTVVWENFKDPYEFKQMTKQINFKMSLDEVKGKWGAPLKVTRHKNNGNEFWRYPLGIELRFSNGKLTSWSSYSARIRRRCH